MIGGMSNDNYYASPQALPSPKRRTGLWIGLLAIVGLCSLCCCGGVGWFVYYGLTLTTDEVRDQVADNPALVEQIGELTSMDMDYTRSMADQDEDAWYYRVRGTKGEGTLEVRQITDAQGDKTKGKLAVIR